MRFLLKHGKKKDLITLTVIYIFTHGMLLILSGRWWDDWCMYNISAEVMKKFALSEGRPSLYFYWEFAKAMPEAGYRIITFFMYYFCALFLYKILKNWLMLSDKACFWSCALYIVIPANDCRVMLAVFPYTIGLFFFMAGMSILSGILRGNRMTWPYRIFLWLLFTLGFTLNSNLCFYVIVLLMILMETKSIKDGIKYLDFLILPIIFFAVKSIYFPAYGAYEEYNNVTIGAILVAIKYIVFADLFMLKNLCINFLSIMEARVFLVACTGLIVAFIALNRNKLLIVLMQIFNKNYIERQNTQNTITNENIESTAVGEDILICIIGFITLSAGLFSYVVVRQRYYIYASNTPGRDATLVAFGAAMLIYGVASLIFNRELHAYGFVLLILCGFTYFNTYYLSYQQDYYRQLGFQYQLREHAELENLSNIVYLNADSSLVNIYPIYALNGSAEMVYGNQTRFFMTRGSDVLLLQDDDRMDYFVECGYYNMSQYDRSHKRIDAVIQYSFDVNLQDVLKMKVYEIIGDSRFENWIQNRSNMNVYLDGTEEYERLLADYHYENIVE